MSSSRRSSLNSLSSSDHGSPSSPLLRDTLSNATLIFVQDDDDDDDDDDEPSSAPLDFSSDDDLADDFGSHLDRIRTSSVPPLSPSLILLYLLTPFLKLGSMFIPDTGTPLNRSIAVLLAFALFAACSRHLCYMLAKYVHNPDLEEIVLDAFARGRGKERRRAFLRSLVRFGTGLLRVLLATVYLRASVDALLPLSPTKMPLSSRIVFSILLALVILPLCLAPSLAAKRVVYATWISVAAYIVWLGSVSFAHAQGTLDVSSGRLRTGILWQGTTIIAFSFATTWTLPLYASLRGSAHPLSTTKKRRHSFKLLSVASVGLAVALMLPLCFFAAAPIPPDLLARAPNPLMAVSNTVVLVLAIPPLVVTIPPLPISLSLRRATNLPIPKLIIYLLIPALSLLPAQPSAILSDIILVLALASTYVLPAVLHVTMHHFKRPLSIVIPSAVHTPSAVNFDRAALDRADADELLQRKERTLQRKRLGRRLVWDVTAWALLLPVGGGGLLWAIGRINGTW